VTHFRDPIAAAGGDPVEDVRRDPIDPVEAALADALRRAAEAGQWSTVEVLAKELEARREAQARKAPAVVVSLRDRIPR